MIVDRLKAAGYDNPQVSADYEGLNLNEFAANVFPDLMKDAHNPRF